MSLKSKVIHGSALNLIEHAIRLAAMLVVTPFMISRLGLAQYGIWLLLSAAISFLALLDAGLTLSGTRYLSRALGGCESPGDVLSTLRWLYHRIGVICFLATILLALGAPLFISDPVWQSVSQVAISALGGTLALRFFLRIHLVVLKAHLHYNLLVAAAIIKTFVHSLLIYVLLSLGHGILAVALTQIIADLLELAIIVMFSRRIAPNVGRSPKPNKLLLSDILRYSRTTFLQILGQQLRNRVDPFFLTAFVGITAVPIYNMAQRLIGIFDDLVNAALGGTLLAAFSQIDGKAESVSLHGIFFRTLRYSVVIGLTGTMGIFVLGPTFLALWLGDEFTDSGTYLRLLLIPAALKLIQYPGFSLLYSTDQHHWLTRITFAAGIANATLSFFLVLWIGTIGVVLATVIEMTISFLLVFPIIISRTLKIPVLTYLSKLLTPAARIIMPLLTWGLITPAFLHPTYLSLTLSAAGLLIVSATTSFFLLLGKIERTNLARNILQRLQVQTKLL